MRGRNRLLARTFWEFRQRAAVCAVPAVLDLEWHGERVWLLLDHARSAEVIPLVGAIRLAAQQVKCAAAKVTTQLRYGRGQRAGGHAPSPCGGVQYQQGICA